MNDLSATAVGPRLKQCGVFPRCSSCRSGLQDDVFLSFSRNDRVQPVVVDLSSLLRVPSMRMVKMTMSNCYRPRGKMFDLNAVNHVEKKTFPLDDPYEL